MAFREIVAPTVKELFIQQLEGMILSGELRPGDRLPTERELADEMKISKTVVHEGLRELHRLGFHILSTATPDTCVRAVFPEYKGFAAKDPIAEYDELIAKNGFFAELVARQRLDGAPKADF